MLQIPVCYVVTVREDTRMLLMAHASILSLRYTHPHSDVRLIVDAPTAEILDTSYPELREVVNEVVVHDTQIEKAGHSSRYLKINLRKLVAGDLIFLDIDTVVLREISPLTNHDCTLAGVEAFHLKGARLDLDAGCLKWFNQLGWPQYTGPCLNTGVLFWRDNEEGHRLSQVWYKAWRQALQADLPCKDQPPLYNAITETGVSIQLMPDNYNQMSLFVCPRRLIEPTILHYSRGKAFRHYALLNHLMRYIQKHGTLDVRAIERARKRNDPWVSAPPGIKCNWYTGRYLNVAREAWKRLLAWRNASD